MARPAAVGRRAQSVSPSHLKVVYGLRARRTKRRRDTPPSISARLVGHVTLKADAGGKIVACFDRHVVGLGTFSAQAVDRAMRLHAGLPAFFVCTWRQKNRQRTGLIGPAPGPARTVGVPAPPLAKRRGPGRHRAAGCGLLAAHAAAQRCRCPGAIAVCIYAPSRQRDGAGIAARWRAVQNLRPETCGHNCPPLDATKDQTPRRMGCREGPSRAVGRLLKSSSKSMRAAAASGPTRAMTIWFFGTFTISCSTPAARKADTPTCSAEFFLMSASYRRYRRCGLVGPERKSICASFRRSRRQQ